MGLVAAYDDGKPKTWRPFRAAKDGRMGWFASLGVLIDYDGPKTPIRWGRTGKMRARFDCWRLNR